ncbi:MAG: hypothetical protein Kow006_23500 [Gammaproteobacteria bacterium]
MASRRLKEIQRMFDEMGLGRSEERRRFTEMAGKPVSIEETQEEPAKEQLFIRLENNTLEAGESQHG